MTDCNTTHHNACDCREAYFKSLEKKLKRYEEALKAISMSAGTSTVREYTLPAFHFGEALPNTVFTPVHQVAREALENK